VTAQKLGLPVENLMTPDTIRRVLWTPPNSADLLRQVLSDHNARPWQIEIVFPVLETAIWNLAAKETTEP
jgi:ribonuclease D